MRFTILVVMAFTISSACSNGETADDGGGNHDGSAASGSGGGSHSDAEAAQGGNHPDASSGEASGDKLAAAACAALSPGGSPKVEVVALSAALSSEKTEVEEASIRVDGSTAYRIRLPEGQEGWVSLVQEHWNATVAFFAPKDVEYEVLNREMQPLSPAPLANAACPAQNLTDYRIKFLHWNLAKIRFSKNGPREVMFMVIKDPDL